MPVPKPPTSLDNSCLVIHDKTLYSYSPEAFMSIPLDNDAQWKKLEMGIKVTGAACVGSTPPDASQAGFYVVGGKGGSDDFSGLQKYTYSTGKWTPIKLTDQVTNNRQGHAATYIRANDAILMYAGHQDDNRGPSSHTFTIEISKDFTVSGHESSAPPAVSPLMLSWSDADAAMITGGGDAQDAKVWLFNPVAGWRDSGASLKVPLADRASKRLALLTADDGSKVLYVFNIRESPITVDRILVQDAKGDPVHESSPVERRSLVDDMAPSKRRLTWDKWPKYNSTFAPEGMGQDVAMALGANGLIAFANKDSLEFFDARENRWMNATAMLGEKEQQVTLFSTATTSASSPSITPSSTSGTSSITQTTSEMVASSSAGGVSANQNKEASGLSSNAILGITLGCILGLMALLGLLLLLLRRRKRRRQSPQVDGAADEKDSAAFAPGAMPARSAAGQLRGHYPKASRESWSSMAILMGRVGKDRPGLNKRLSNGTIRSSVSSLHKILKSTISKPIPQSATQPVLVGQDEKNVAFAPEVGKPRPRPRISPAEANDNTRRSSGWNRYWSGGSALQILGLGPAKRNTAVSEQSSRYSEAGNSVKVRQDSATVPPLNLDGRPEVSNVVSGSPMVSQFTSDVRSEGLSGKIVRPASRTSSGYSSGVPESINEAWYPTEAGNWGGNRMPSASAYTPSYYFEASAPSAVIGRPLPPSGVSQQPQLAMAATSSDMSWLNLGDQSRL
ncbi:pre-mRNA splicing factor CLF1 [Ophiocordyceps sinensis CO18]|uniref:Pre-mRNA splicing factor CLF1 n=1 Tax=Ophiocordyceps sinensis (strain Co18 / CGMCC 3.14243) TaxID=911162 RepID=T5A9W9_OPHSC|nr:pre-mRNA splicing factor CLF1 [Ophiocordyceps sinensis CO18]